MPKGILHNRPCSPELWICGQACPIVSNATIVLQAFLSFNKNFKISLSIILIRRFDIVFFKQNILIYESVARNPNTLSLIGLK
jgi:hypothetical protein